MKFLLTNDDGVDAPGLQALLTAAQPLGACVVVAPSGPRSGCSHQVTTDGPLRLELRGGDRYAIDGTPADCVRVGLHRVLPDATWVLSGINAGGNLGADVYHSGTVAAVREAVLHGWPGIAVSHYIRRDRPLDWARAAAWATPILADLMSRPRQRGSFWNVNLPHPAPDAPPPEVVFCPLDPMPLPLSYRRVGDRFHYDGNYHDRRREPGADVDVCFSGRTAVTRICLF